MDDFRYIDGVLHCEAIDARKLAGRFGTPVFVYSAATLLEHYRRIQQAFAPLGASICFSVKSCQNLAILRLLAAHGSGFDVVSGGELRRVLEAGGAAERVVFAGVGKTDDEMDFALRTGIGWFNAESEWELERLSRLARAAERKARVALRVNPDVDPATHVYTTTGKRETKFGVDILRAGPVIRKFHRHPGLDLTGIHLHLGSPVNRAGPYVAAVERVRELIDNLRRDRLVVSALNIGGGFGAHYDGSEAPDAAAYARAIVPLLADRGLEILLEPGRCIAANAGVLLTRVLDAKTSGRRRFVIVDAAMTDLIRPALYGAFHFAWPVQPAGDLIPAERRADLHLDGTELVDIVGPVCESGDFLAKDRWLPPVSSGDFVCLFTAGAYGFTMSSQYNSRPRAAEVLIEGGEARLIRRRETYDDLVAAERL